jgi:hypothetical protein
MDTRKQGGDGGSVLRYVTYGVDGYGGLFFWFNVSRF